MRVGEGENCLSLRDLQVLAALGRVGLQRAETPGLSHPTTSAHASGQVESGWYGSTTTG